MGVAAALLCSRIFDVRVLDLLNVLGAAVAIIALMRWYLPLEQAPALAVGASLGRAPRRRPCRGAAVPRRRRPPTAPAGA